MPAVRRYRVVETRELQVSAETPSEAVAKAAENLKAHDNGQLLADDIGMRVTDISASEV